MSGGIWQVGAAITFIFPADVIDETLTGEVLAVEEPNLLHFAWGEETLRFELTQHKGGTRLVLVDELPPGAAARNAAGWDECLNRLIGLAPAPDAWKSRFAAYSAAFESALGPQEGPPADYNVPTMDVRPTHMPDLSARPLDLTVERRMAATPATLYRAWTERFDSWFAAPGSVLMRAAVNEPFFFETEGGGQRHPHYGRFLRLDPDRLVQLTWVTGTGGTEGTETVVTVELSPVANGALLRLTHAGFPHQTARDGHEQAWPIVLAQLDERTA